MERQQLTLLTSADALATTCAKCSKNCFGQHADNASYVVTEESTFATERIKQLRQIQLIFSDGSDNDILLIGSGAPRIYS